MDTPLPFESAPYDSHYTTEHRLITLLPYFLFFDQLHKYNLSYFSKSWRYFLTNPLTVSKLSVMTELGKKKHTGATPKES